MKWILVLVPFLASWVMGGLVPACDCTPLSGDRALTDPQIESVFLGEVGALEETIRERSGHSFRFHLVTLVPSAIWKGAISSSVEVLTPYEGTACGEDFSRPGQYLVFGYRLDSELHTGSCDSYGPGANSQRIAELGDPIWRSEDGAPFVRGEANADGSRDISDAVFILNFLFGGGATPGCLDAADADDSGTLEITDPVAILNALFLGGPHPPVPGPDRCGTDPTVDDLECSSFESCA